MSAEALRLYGTEEPVEPAQRLHAGPLTLELQRGQLRRIRCGALEVWHGLAFVLRDADWGTPQPELHVVDVQGDGHAFELRIEGRFAAGLDYRLHAVGRADGSVHVDVEAVPRTDLHVNRVGLCLMHPLTACGACVEVRHVDGRRSASTFPTLIPPWPPFMLVRALRHEWAPGRWAEAELLGDLFETEDQRNNGDASFKTYSRSNMAPRPCTLHAGVMLRQSAVLRVDAGPPVGADRPPLAVTVAVGASAGALPPIGIEIEAADAAVPALREVLAELRPAHLHLAWRPGLAVDWHGVAAMLAAAGARLRLDATPVHRAALLALKRGLDEAGLVPESLAVFPSEPSTIATAHELFRGSAIGGGTPHFFVQLSRLDALGDVDFASFTTSALVHGAADDDVMLGLASLSVMVETWRARHPEIPLRVGPNGIAARASPLGAQPASDGTRRIALAAIDPRSRAQFGAAWALGHAAAFAGAGVDAITLGALAGPRGVVAVEGGRIVYHPAFAVLQELGRPAQRLACTVSHPDRIAALALRRGASNRLLLANLSAEPQTVQLDTAILLQPFAVSTHG